MWGKVDDSISLAPFFLMFGSIAIGWLWAKGTNLTRWLIVGVFACFAAVIGISAYMKATAKHSVGIDSVSSTVSEKKDDVKKKPKIVKKVNNE